MDSVIVAESATVAPWVAGLTGFGVITETLGVETGAG